MAQRRAVLHFMAIETLKEKNDRVSVITDGFGDFSFKPSASQCTRCRKMSSNSISSTVTSSISPQSNSSPPETVPPWKDHKQSLSFLYLPSEIRCQIYSYLTHPFKNFHGHDRIQFRIDKITGTSPRRCHPFRDGYEIYIPNAMTRTNLHGIQRVVEHQHHHIQPEDYQALLVLSQLSRQVRSEVGAIVWRNVEVEIEDLEYLFLNFLICQPAVCPGIRKLRMTWDCHNETSYLDLFIPDFCEYVSKHLVLDELEFTLKIYEKTAKELVASGGESTHWVQCLRKILTKKLTVLPYITKRCGRGELDLQVLAHDLEIVLRPRKPEVRLLE